MVIFIQFFFFLLKYINIFIKIKKKIKVNDHEKLLHIITMMITCGFFAYCISAVGNIFNSFKTVEEEVKNKMYTINNFMRKKGINI